MSLDRIKRDARFWAMEYSITKDFVLSLDNVSRGVVGAEVMLDSRWLINAITVTNNIEGYNLTIADTKVIANGGRVSNYKWNALVSDFVNGYKFVSNSVCMDLSTGYILNLHRILLRNTDSGIAGEFKNGNNFVMQDCLFLDYREVSPAVENLLCRYNSVRKDFHSMPNYEVVQTIARFKQDFINIHPFMDGNGRVSRLIVQKELAYVGLPPILFNESKRKRYHDIMGIGYTLGIGGTINDYLVYYIGKEILSVVNRGDFKFLKE